MQRVSPTNRRDFDMATTKNITKVDALNIALAVAHGENVDTACENAGWTANEFAAKVAAMLEQENKRKSAPKRPTKAQMQNGLLVDRVVALIAEHGEPVSVVWVRDNSGADILTTQKATAICTRGVKEGKLERIRDEKGKVKFTALN